MHDGEAAGLPASSFGKDPADTCPSSSLLLAGGSTTPRLSCSPPVDVASVCCQGSLIGDGNRNWGAPGRPGFQEGLEDEKMKESAPRRLIPVLEPTSPPEPLAENGGDHEHRAERRASKRLASIDTDAVRPRTRIAEDGAVEQKDRMDDEAGGVEVAREDERQAKRKKVTQLGTARSALKRSQGLTRDSCHWCYFCKHVFWTGTETEDCDRSGPSFCTLCGSKLMRGARDAALSYSSIAQSSDAQILRLMEMEAGDVDNVAAFSHPGSSLPALQTEIAQRTKTVQPRRGKSNSKFCDICGHGGVHIHCSRCPTSFHKMCLVLPAHHPLPNEGWWCSCCMHEAIREGEIPPLPFMPMHSKRTLPSTPQHCSSCGYPEIESINCDACCRWFCYGCMCISQEFVSDEWACPECVGQKAYDEKLSQQIKTSRERFLAGKMMTKERDGFSQLVFDLYCMCNWSEWRINVEALISDNKARLLRDPSYLPTILPFQSLHYPLHKRDIMLISEAYAKAAETKACRAYRMAESRIRSADEKGKVGAEEEQRVKCEDASRGAVDEKGAGGDSRDRRMLMRSKEGSNNDVVSGDQGDETPKTLWREDAMDGEVTGGAGSGASLGVEREETGESEAEDTVGVAKAAPSVRLPTASAPLPEITMWKPELCRQGASETGTTAGAAKERLRIGYISSDFVNHPTSDLIIRALLLHNNENFETFCYSLAKDDNSTYRRILERDIRNFRLMPKSLSDRQCAAMIAEDGIHILVNLNGHTAGDRNGISALRPAPLQIVYLAYPGTMGAKYIDYNVVDPYVCPPEHREFYTERLLYMPHCYQANSFHSLYQEVLSIENQLQRADYQLPEDAFVFCNFCRLGRITEELFGVWMRILQKVPNSILWLYKHPRAAMYRLQEAARGIDPSLVGRIIFAPPCSPKLEHLKRVTLADLCLDTTVYNGHTTGSDMLWAGVPMITVRGDNWPSRVASCLALSIDMPFMVMEDLHEYEDTAVRLALNPAELLQWRTTLASNRLSSPLFDTERWVRSFEDGLEQMWEMWVDNKEQRQALIDIKCRDFGKSPSMQEGDVSVSL